ncbi:MAG: right-handed parallel beta-helix repeat-containing protein [Sandaracinaceae bacterium]
MNFQNLRKLAWLFAALGALSLVACGSSGTDMGPDDDDMGGETGEDMGPQPDQGMVDMGDEGCPPIEDRTVVDVDAGSEIDSPTTWTCDNLYVLRNGVVYVTDVLTIEAGTRVHGQVGEQTALIATVDGRIDANGTAELPIVFTSSNSITEGSNSGDWGGVALLGLASLNTVGGTSNLEGLPAGETRGTFGGGESPDDSYNCGTMRYVRIEYAGAVFAMDEELNSLTLGGCGSDTTLEFVQTTAGLDDGVEFFGGTASIKWGVVFNTGDDSLDWQLGWRGNAQFYIAQQNNIAGEDRCIEADNLGSNFDAMPESNPNVYNLTCVSAGAGGSNEQDGFFLRRGTPGTVENNIVVNATDQGIAIDADRTMERLTGAATPPLTVENNIVFNNNNQFVGISDTGNTTLENDTVTQLTADNREVDPELPTFDEASPDFAPPAGGEASMGAAATPGDAFFTDADYVGAIEPGTAVADQWWFGWTDFQPN